MQQPYLNVVQFTDAQKKQVETLFNENMSQDDIARTMGVSRPTIKKLLTGLGLKRSVSEAGKMAHGKTDEEVQRVRELRVAGKTITEVASELNSSIAAIGRIVKKHDLYYDRDLSQVAREYQDGSNYNELATKYGVSTYTIAKELKKSGVAARSGAAVYTGISRPQELPDLMPYQDTAEWYRHAYIDNKCSMPMIIRFIKETTSEKKSVGSIAGKLAKYGIKLRSVSESTIRIDHNAVIEAYSRLNSMSKVAIEIGCTVQHVKNILTANHIDISTTSEIMSGEGNPFYGQCHTQETKKQCAAMGAIHGSKFWLDNPEYVEVVRTKQKALWADLEKRARQSQLITELRQQGKCKSKKGVLSTRFGDIAFDSSYEASFIELCDRNRHVVMLEHDFMFIKYEYNGDRHYLPDYRVWLSNGEFIIVEMKSDWFAMQPKERAKIMAGFDLLSGKFMVATTQSGGLKLIEDRIDLIMSPLDFEFSDITIKEISRSEYIPFYGAYHYLGKTGRSGHTIGAYLHDQLLACATIGGITRVEMAEKQKAQVSEMKELIRFCIHPEFHKRNFGSWFLGRATKAYKSAHQHVRLLISFADASQGHIGTIYEAANWEYDGDTGSSYHYILDGQRIHKKTIYDKAVKAGLIESEYMQQTGASKVRELPKRRYLYRLNN